MNFDQMKRLHHSRAAVFSWNKYVVKSCNYSKELSTFIVPSPSSTHSVVSGRHLLYGRSRRAGLAEVSVTEHILRKFPNYTQGELSMLKQCVPGSFFSAHTREPGNKASSHKTLHIIILNRAHHVCNLYIAWNRTQDSTIYSNTSGNYMLTYSLS